MIAGPRVAVALMTRIPLRPGGEATMRELSRAAAWFPAVGLLVGGAMAATHAVAGVVTTATAATVLALAAAIVLTGGLHEDGLADSADALGAQATRARRLDILHDPRLGTYGTLALILALALSVACLAPLAGEQFARTVLVAHVLARWTTLPQALWLPAARASGAGALVRPSGLAVAGGTLFTVAVCVALAGIAAAAVVLAIAAAITAAGGWAARRALGGTTGDTYGAVNKLVEVAVYVAL